MVAALIVSVGLDLSALKTTQKKRSPSAKLRICYV